MCGKAVSFSTLRCTVDKGKAKFQISKDWQKTRGSGAADSSWKWKIWKIAQLQVEIDCQFLASKEYGKETEHNKERKLVLYLVVSEKVL